MREQQRRHADSLCHLAQLDGVGVVGGDMGELRRPVDEPLPTPNAAYEAEK